jgi:Protein of unknown function (DUF4231)
VTVNPHSSIRVVPESAKAAGIPRPRDVDDERDVVWQELSRAFGWYDRAATRCRAGYLTLRSIALLLGAVVTVLAAIDAPPALTAGLAGATVVVEGTLQLFQLHANWISYRASAETLRQHALQYAASVDPYADPLTRRGRLAAALLEVLSAERTSWMNTVRQSDAAQPQKP